MKIIKVKNYKEMSKTASDIVYRLSQTIELADIAIDDVAVEILQRADVGNSNNDDIFIGVFNLSPHPVSNVIEAVVDVASELCASYVSLEDLDGNEMKLQHKARHEKVVPVCVENSRALPFKCDRHQLYFETGNVPAYGYRV